MKLRVLGSATGQAMPDRNASGYLLNHDEHLILLDAGDGISRQLARYGIDFNRIESIFISHMHPDHAAGIFTLVQQMYLKNRKSDLKLFLPEAVTEKIRDIFPVFNMIPERFPFELKVAPLPDGRKFTDWGFRFHAIQNGHTAKLRPFESGYRMRFQSYSFSFESDEWHLLYTADTDSPGNLKSMMTDRTVLLSECTHIDPEETIALATKRNIRKLIFTHINPIMLERLQSLMSQTTYPFLTAEDGKEYEL